MNAMQHIEQGTFCLWGIIHLHGRGGRGQKYTQIQKYANTSVPLRGTGVSQGTVNAWGGVQTGKRSLVIQIQLIYTNTQKMQECGAGWRKVPLVEVKKQRELHKRSSAKIALVQPRGGKRGWYLALISPSGQEGTISSYQYIQCSF